MLPRNGLLDRRTFLTAGAGVLSSAVLPSALAKQTWESGPGRAPSEYGEPSKFSKLKRLRISGHPFAPEAGASSWASPPTNFLLPFLPFLLDDFLEDFLEDFLDPFLLDFLLDLLAFLLDFLDFFLDDFFLEAFLLAFLLLIKYL